jgi:ABC-type Mn2+/Zn2+ transport system ATPase subunit
MQAVTRGAGYMAKPAQELYDSLDLFQSELKVPKFCGFLLFGPNGTGKTSIVKSTLGIIILT